MISFNFTKMEDGWFESQSIQVSGSIAINLTFDDTNDNRVVLLKSSTGIAMYRLRRILMLVLVVI